MTAITVEVLKQRIPVLEAEANDLFTRYHQVLGQISEDRAWVEWLEGEEGAAATKVPAAPPDSYSIEGRPQ